MNKIFTTLIGTSLLAGALYAGQFTSNDTSNSQCQSACNFDTSKAPQTGLEVLDAIYAENAPFGDA
jgi:hypothetical protein